MNYEPSVPGDGDLPDGSQSVEKHVPTRCASLGGNA